MCCGQKVHHDALDILRKQAIRNMSQRPEIVRIQQEITKTLIQPPQSRVIPPKTK